MRRTSFTRGNRKVTMFNKQALNEGLQKGEERNRSCRDRRRDRKIGAEQLDNSRRIRKSICSYLKKHAVIYHILFDIFSFWHRNLPSDSDNYVSIEALYSRTILAIASDPSLFHGRMDHDIYNICI